jgi:putative hydrolase of the HAD superfamily
MRNLALFGYGVKSFALSSIETAIDLTEGNIPAAELRALVEMAKTMLAHPVELLEGVAETVAALAKDYTLIAITKGELQHQESKFHRSGLAAHFTALEVVAEKDASRYERILARHELAPARFLMVGNSLRSDILPVLELGGQAAYIPYPLLWDGEHAEPPVNCSRFHPLHGLRELPALLARLNANDAG